MTRPALSIQVLWLLILTRSFILLFEAQLESKSLLFIVVLFEDLLLALASYILLDYLPAKFKRLKIIANIAAMLLIFIIIEQIRIFQLFGTQLTFGLLNQADKFTSFKEGLIAEISWFEPLNFVISVFFVFIISPLTSKLKYIWRMSLCLTILIPLRIFIEKPLINYQTLDRNTIVDIVLQYLVGEEKDIRQKSSKTFSADSVLAKNQLPIWVKIPGRLKKKMNLLIVTIESTPAKYVSFVAGNKQTPFLAKLSEHALVLENHYAPAPASMKAIYALITGKYPPRTRSWEKFASYAKKQLSIAEILKSQGYKTAYFYSGKGQVYNQREIIESSYGKFNDIKELSKKYRRFENLGYCIDDAVLVDALKDQLTALKKDEKFFIHLNTTIPHHPYYFPKHFKAPIASRQRKSRYLNALNYIDTVVAKIYQTIIDNNLAQSTLVLIQSDHGEAFYEHKGNFIHSLYLYEENIHSIAMFINPVLFKQTIFYKEPSNHVDFMPTILDLFGLKLPATIDGQSLLSPHSPQATFSYTEFSTKYVSVRDTNYKYIYNIDYKTQELYDLLTDPKEKINITIKQPEVTQKLSKAANRFIDYLL